ncbi:MAG: amino acid ABC transporter permease [Oscillospiraceae bacterium]|nr:amino acid ABC transporter permease [Oscillospiraceae bacterium]
MEKLVKLWCKYYPVFLQGLGGTLWLAAVTVLCGTVLGMLIAFLRMSRVRALNAVAKAYTEILRGTPILLQLYFFWLALPKLMPFEMSDTACIVVALIINSSSYICEVIRAGIEAVDKGQWEAARSLGLTERNVLQRVILPQAIKNILPALGNQFILMVKETSLASVFFIGELTTSYKTVQSTTFLSIEPLIIVGIIYLLVTTLLSKAVAIFERRLQVSD